MNVQLALTLPLPMRLAAPQRVALPDPEDEAQAEARYQAIQLLFDYRSDPDRFGLLRLRDGTPITSSTRMIAYIAEIHGTSERTVNRWIANHKKSGRPGLADRTRSDKNTSRFFAAHPKAAWLVAYLFLECKQSVMVCHEAILRDAALIEVPEEELPSYETVRNWLRSVPPSLTVYARNGRKAYRDQMSPFLKRAYTDIFSNEVWIGDVAILDLEGQNDTFEDAEYGAPIRIRLDANIDYRSRIFTGVSFCWEGSSRSIAASLSRGIRQYGAPEVWYTDNGKPQKKAAKGALPGYLRESPIAPIGWRSTEIETIEATGFLARAGIRIQHCLPYSPQSKAVERAFRTVHERFDKAWPTYTSGSPFTRPDSTTVAMIRHRRLLSKGQLEKSNHPRVSEIIAMFLAWTEEYADTSHSGEGMEGATPRQVFEANLNPRQKPTPEPAALALLMAEHEKRQVRECAVQLNKRRYVPVDQPGWLAMHNLNQCEVLVAYEPGDPEFAAALDLDGHFITSLKCEEMARFAPGDPHTQAQIAESMSQRRRLEKGHREALELVSKVARANGAQSPIESMASRLQLSASTDISDVITQRKPKLAANKPAVAPMTSAQVARSILED